MSADPALPIRIAGPSDAAILADVAAATFALACPPGTASDDVADFISKVLSEERFAEYLADPARTLLVAGNGTPVGYAMMVEGSPADPDVAAAVSVTPAFELSKMYVRPERHRSGAAQALMAASLAVARDAAAAGVWLGVNQLNVRAQKFYRKSGFDVVGTKTFQVGAHRHDDFVMQLTF